LLLVAQSAAPFADTARDAEQHGDIDVGVVLDSNAQHGLASASVRIRADREVVWSMLTSCSEAGALVPGLIDCRVLETAPDRSWQLIRHVVDYSWFVPKLTYEFRATYEYPARISIERVSGGLRTLNCSWDLKSDGEFTVLNFSLELAPGFWVPRWIVRLALKQDLPRMLRALRADSEAAQRRAAT
jgi:hypothetical protein